MSFDFQFRPFAVKMKAELICFDKKLSPGKRQSRITFFGNDFGKHSDNRYYIAAEKLKPNKNGQPPKLGRIDKRYYILFAHQEGNQTTFYKVNKNSLRLRLGIDKSAFTEEIKEKKNFFDDATMENLLRKRTSLLKEKKVDEGSQTNNLHYGSQTNSLHDGSQTNSLSEPEENESDVERNEDSISSDALSEKTEETPDSKQSQANNHLLLCKELKEKLGNSTDRDYNDLVALIELPDYSIDPFNPQENTELNVEIEKEKTQAINAFFKELKIADGTVRSLIRALFAKDPRKDVEGISGEDRVRYEALLHAFYAARAPDMKKIENFFLNEADDRDLGRFFYAANAQNPEKLQALLARPNTKEFFKNMLRDKSDCIVDAFAKGGEAQVPAYISAVFKS